MVAAILEGNKMNIRNEAKQWLLDHNYGDDNLQDLVNLIDRIRYYQGYIGDKPEYDPNFGDDKPCQCGHIYYRHFDTYDHMSPIGCKYCFHWSEDIEKCHSDNHCTGFEEQK